MFFNDQVVHKYRLIDANLLIVHPYFETISFLKHIAKQNKINRFQIFNQIKWFKKIYG